MGQGPIADIPDLTARFKQVGFDPVGIPQPEGATSSVSIGPETVDASAGLSSSSISPRYYGWVFCRSGSAATRFAPTLALPQCVGRGLAGQWNDGRSDQNLLLTIEQALLKQKTVDFTQRARAAGLVNTYGLFVPADTPAGHLQAGEHELYNRLYNSFGQERQRLAGEAIEKDIAVNRSYVPRAQETLQETLNHLKEEETWLRAYNATKTDPDPVLQTQIRDLGYLKEYLADRVRQGATTLLPPATAQELARALENFKHTSEASTPQQLEEADRGRDLLSRLNGGAAPSPPSAPTEVEASGACFKLRIFAIVEIRGDLRVVEQDGEPVLKVDDLGSSADLAIRSGSANKATLGLIRGLPIRRAALNRELAANLRSLNFAGIGPLSRSDVMSALKQDDDGEPAPWSSQSTKRVEGPGPAASP